jgi:nucleotide-binding universal stress UspA family protein
MIKKILVPFDGSTHSVKAVELASDLASKYDAEIMLLHVLLRGHMPEGLKRAMEVEVGHGAGRSAHHLVNYPQEILARVDDKKTTQMSVDELNFIGEKMLSGVVELCREKGVNTVTKHIDEGNPVEIILKLSESADVDMIVMGSRGLSELKGMLLGSVSYKVNNLSKCTCVTVK